MRVVVVDDEPLARDRIKRLLSEFPGYEVVGEAGDGETALDLIDEEEPDLVLLDLMLPGEDGLSLSAGERARLALERVRLSDADLLLVDEPTAHLDEAAAAAVDERRKAGDKALLVGFHTDLGGFG